MNLYYTIFELLDASSLDIVSKVLQKIYLFINEFYSSVT